MNFDGSVKIVHMLCCTSIYLDKMCPLHITNSVDELTQNHKLQIKNRFILANWLRTLQEMETIKKIILYLSVVM